MDGKSNKVVSGCASNIKMLAKMFDNVQDEASVVATYQAVIHSNDDDDKIT